MKVFWAGFGLVGLGLGLVIGYNGARWNRKTLQLAEKLKDRTSDQEAKAVTFENFDQLPEPVAHYLRFALREGQPLIRSVRLKQVGSLRGLEKSRAGWMPFTAVQSFSARRPGFVWDARIRASFLMHMRVRDSYVAGQGASEVNAFSLMTIADEHGSAEAAQGSLVRYLAEAVWFPTALLPSSRLSWSPIDANKALATLTDAGTTVSLEFRFNAAGEVTGFYTPGRYRAVEGKYVLTPWGGQLRSYEEREGMWIPIEGEIEWHLPDGEFSVFKGKTTEIKYSFLCKAAPMS